MSISVAIVEDLEDVREGLAALVDAADGFACAATFADAEAFLDALSPPRGGGLRLDVALMDIGLPGIDGIEGARRFRERVPTARVVILTVHEEDENVVAAICAGASGYLLKPTSPDRIVEAVREVEAGAAPINGFIAGRVLTLLARLASPGPDYGLTPREHDTLELLVAGLTMKEVAARMGVSYHTVDTHVRHVYAKLQVRSRGGAVAKALRERIV